jgi:hypothetical protein
MRCVAYGSIGGYGVRSGVAGTGDRLRAGEWNSRTRSRAYDVAQTGTS